MITSEGENPTMKNLFNQVSRCWKALFELDCLKLDFR